MKEVKFIEKKLQPRVAARLIKDLFKTPVTLNETQFNVKKIQKIIM